MGACNDNIISDLLLASSPGPPMHAAFSMFHRHEKSGRVWYQNSRAIHHQYEGWPGDEANLLPYSYTGD